MDPKFSSEAVRGVLSKQKVIDLEMSLKDLINRVGDAGDPVGYWVIAFDRYCFVVEHIAGQVTLEDKRRKLAVLNASTFNLNVKLKELTELAFDSNLDQVGFNLIAWDKVVLLTHQPGPEEGVSSSGPRSYS